MYIPDNGVYDQYSIMDGLYVHDEVTGCLLTHVSSQIYDVNSIQEFILDLIIINSANRMVDNVNYMTTLDPSFLVPLFVMLPDIVQDMVLDNFKHNSIADATTNLLITIYDANGNVLSLPDIIRKEKDILINEFLESFMQGRINAAIDELIARQMSSSFDSLVDDSINRYTNSPLLHKNIATGPHAGLTPTLPINTRLTTILTNQQGLVSHMFVGTSYVLDSGEQLRADFDISQPVEYTKMKMTYLYGDRLTDNKFDVIDAYRSLSSTITEFYHSSTHHQSGINLFQGRRAFLEQPPRLVPALIHQLTSSVSRYQMYSDQFYDASIVYYGVGMN